MVSQCASNVVLCRMIQRSSPACPTMHLGGLEFMYTQATPRRVPIPYQPLRSGLIGGLRKGVGYPPPSTVPECCPFGPRPPRHCLLAWPLKFARTSSSYATGDFCKVIRTRIELQVCTHSTDHRATRFGLHHESLKPAARPNYCLRSGVCACSEDDTARFSIY